jgi:hypothetical protein
MMMSAGDVGMVAAVARNFLGWVFTRREDRVAGAGGAAGAATAVVEAPRSDPRTAKPRHAGVRKVAEGEGSKPAE